MKRLFLIALLTPVAGCGGHVEFPRPPEDKLTCAEEPYAPEEPITDSKNAAYLKSLRASWASCKQDVDWLAAWFKSLQK